MTGPTIEELEAMANQSPATKWVNLLFVHMFQNDIERVRLKRSAGLPFIPMGSELPGVEFDKVINRLKVIAGLDAVVYKEPRKGEAQLTFGDDQDFTVKSCFADSGDDPFCEIELVKE